MKKLFLMSIILIAAFSNYGQISFAYKNRLPENCGGKIDADSFSLTVIIKSTDVSDFLKNSRFEVYKQGDKRPGKSGILKDWINLDLSKKLVDSETIQLKRDSIGIENGDSLLIFPFLGKDEKGTLFADTSKDHCAYVFAEAIKPGKDVESASGRLFVDDKMMKSVQEGACGFICDLDTLINKRRERAYFTDYYIRYDASGIGDDFTICKHIIRRNKSKNSSSRLFEGYRRVAPAWFAPSVGSQIKFEVINVGLTDAGKIIVASDDLFLEGAGRFDSFINGKLTTLLGSEGKADGAALQSGKDENLYEKLFEELSEYVLAFKVSACAVESNKKNIMVILARIRKEFKLQGSDVLNELVSKASEEQKSTAIAIKNLIVELGKVRPLVYSTMRARNQDFMNIKVMDAENNEVRNENIRMSYGLKIDFSTGVFLTGLRDFTYGFKDTTVQYQSKDDPNKMIADTGKMIIKQDEGKFNLGFGLLVHWYPRMTSNYNVGLTCGFMSTSNLDLSVLAGGSVMFSSLFGSNMRVSLNGGMAWGKVSRLNNAYYEGYKEVNGRPVFYNDLNTVPVIESWEHSWFVGATFNFGGNRQK